MTANNCFLAIPLLFFAKRDVKFAKNVSIKILTGQNSIYDKDIDVTINYQDVN